MKAPGSFLSDIKEIRRRAGSTAGAVIENYGGNVEDAVALLNHPIATTTCVLLERILAQEEEHANDMHDLLVSHEGRPTLEK